MTPIHTHPFWLVGFRPFFSLGCLSGLALPVLWALMYAGVLPAPASGQAGISMFQWHSHEMFYGFGWAMLGGFLLTSSKNWVKIRGYHGKALMLLTAAWLLDRITLYWGQDWATPLFWLGNSLFLGLLIPMLLWSLLRYRQQDSFPDNTYFILALPLFLIAKPLLLSPEYSSLGSSMTLALFRLAFLLMLERTLTQFMQGIFQVSILRRPLLDHGIKILGLALVFFDLMPPLLAGALSLTLAALLALRLAFWQPRLAMTRIDLGIMYLGYLAIVLQLVLQGLPGFSPVHWVGNLETHVFTFGAMGMILPAMVIRIAKGHTGRKVLFDGLDKTTLWLMVAAFVLRILAPQFFPAAYLHWIQLAAACWFLCFALLAWRYLPWLLQARVDGKEH